LYDYAARNWGQVQETSEEPVEQLLSLLSSEAKVCSLVQAMRVDENYYRFFNYSQNVPKQMTGVHLAAYFGLTKTTIALLQRGHDPDVKILMDGHPYRWLRKSGMRNWYACCSQ
jgi:hypothetical protein